MSSEEICSTARATDVEGSRGDKKDNNEDITDDRCATDGVQLGRDGGVERIARIEDRRNVGILRRVIAGTHRFKNGIFRESHGVRLVDMNDSCETEQGQYAI